MNIFISLSEISVFTSDTLRCVFCGHFTDDLWFYEKSKCAGRCRACASLGIFETEHEKYLIERRRFVPVRNYDLFSHGVIYKENGQEVHSFGEDKDNHLIRFAPQGSLIEFSPRLPVREVARTWRRGDIESFSSRSRSRLNKKFSMLKRDILPLFVTLTYHDYIPDTFEGYKYDLDLFLKWLFRSFPSAGVIWKLEFQKRGYAHFHLFVWGVSLDDLQGFVPDVWHKIAGNYSNFHLAWHKGELGNGNEHCVQSIRSWNGVRSYASKYFAKLDDEKNRGGRIWGIRGSHYELKNGKRVKVSNIPLSKILEFRVNLAVALEFRHSLAQARQYEFQRLGFWTMDYSSYWLTWLYELITAHKVFNSPPDDPPDWDFDEPVLFEDFFGVPVEVFQDV